jgi:hypothetical protein
MENMFTFQPPYSEGPVTVYLQSRNYTSGNVRIDLIDARDHCPYMSVTVNVDGLDENEVAIKNYSENEGILDVLVDEGIVKPPHRHVKSGFVIIPICELC